MLGTDFKKTLNENRSKTFIYFLRIQNCSVILQELKIIKLIKLKNTYLQSDKIVFTSMMGHDVSVVGKLIPETHTLRISWFPGY